MTFRRSSISYEKISKKINCRPMVISIKVATEESLERSCLDSDYPVAEVTEIMRSYSFINMYRVGSAAQNFIRNLFTVEYEFLVTEL